MKKYYILASGLIFFFLLHSTGNAEIYFWTDENGVKHFSNVAPGSETGLKINEEKTINEPFDASQNAVPESEIKAREEKRKAEAEEKKKKLEEERLAEQERVAEAQRKAEEEKLKKEIQDLKRKLRREQRKSSSNSQI